VESLVQKYLSYLVSEKACGLNTILNYKYDLHQFEDFLFNKKLSWKRVDQQTIREFIKFLEERGLATSSIRRKFACLRSFFSFLKLEGLVEADPTEGITVPGPRNLRISIKSLPREAIQSLFDELSGNTDPVSIKNRAVLKIIAETGLEPTDLVSLNLSDVEVNSGSSVLLNLGRSRQIELSGEASSSLILYLDEVRSKVATETEALFVNSRGQRPSRQAIWYSVTKTAKKAGLGEISPKALHNSFIAERMQEGLSSQEIHRLLGHVNEEVRTYVLSG